MAWTWLCLAIVAETTFALNLKMSRGLTVPAWSLGAGLALAVSLTALAQAARDLPIGTIYPIWTGLAAAGIVAAGGILLGEPVGPLKLLSLAAILAGVVGLHIAAQ